MLGGVVDDADESHRGGDRRVPALVDHTGEVFGYQGLFVLDAAVVPEAIGLNPSRTITALAERNVNFVLDRLERPRPTEPWLPPEPTPFRDRERPKED